MKILKKFNFGSFISKAYVEGIYADTPANRKLGRVGMTYAEYAKKLKDDKEEKADKKYWVIKYDSGEEDIFTEDKMSKEKLVEEACKFAEEIAEANNYDEYKFTIQENTDDWKEEDFDKKQYDWLSIKAKKYNGKYEISVYDWGTNEYIRNDREKREKKNLEQKLKRDKEKREKEFKERFGWMEEVLKEKISDSKNEELESLNKEKEIFKDDKEVLDILNEKINKIENNTKKVKDLKSEIEKQINLYKRNNDYIKINTEKGKEISLKRGENNEFSKAIVKKDGKIEKSFTFRKQEDLLNSLSKYLFNEEDNLINDEKYTESSENSLNDNLDIVNNKIEEAKNKNFGTIIVNGNDGYKVYMNRKRESRWLRDFESYSIKDSKGNILKKGNSTSEKELLNKLGSDLQKFNITLK